MIEGITRWVSTSGLQRLRISPIEQTTIRIPATISPQRMLCAARNDRIISGRDKRAGSVRTVTSADSDVDRPMVVSTARGVGSLSAERFVDASESAAGELASTRVATSGFLLRRISLFDGVSERCGLKGRGVRIFLELVQLDPKLSGLLFT